MTLDEQYHNFINMENNRQGRQSSPKLDLFTSGQEHQERQANENEKKSR